MGISDVGSLAVCVIALCSVVMLCLELKRKKNRIRVEWWHEGSAVAIEADTKETVGMVQDMLIERARKL